MTWEAVKLQARPADGGDWCDIYPAQLAWMSKQGLDVRALEPPFTPDWREIDTAPKDKPIMLCVAGYLPCTGRWWPIDSCWTSFDWEGHFESDKECSNYVNGTSYEPTHWAPMPDGPAMSPAERGTGA